MRTTVSVQELYEAEIRPEGLMREYRALCEASMRALTNELVPAYCPADPEHGRREAFHRGGLSYVECVVCGSVYATPRPTEPALAAHYADSPAVWYWRERVLAPTRRSRAEKVIDPRLHWILEGMAEHQPSPSRIVDLGTHSHTLLARLSLDRPVEIVAAGMTAVEDVRDLDGVRADPLGVNAIPSIGPADVVIAADALDRAPDARALVNAMWQLLRPGGIVFATAASISGFEHQVLWADSPTIVPPDRLNLLSITGLEILFSPAKWRILELSTPGMFDIETVRRVVAAAPDRPWPRFVRQVTGASESGRASFQEWLQRSRLASHARIVARREV